MTSFTARRVVTAAGMMLSAAIGANAQTGGALSLRLVPPQSGGAPDTAISLTLDDAISRGLATSHRLAQAVARGEAATAVVGERRAAQLPVLSAQAGYTRTNHVDIFGFPQPGVGLVIIYPDVPNNYRTRLDVQWPIYTAGRLNALERAAQAEASATGDDLAAARADLRLEITRAYWAFATAIESVRVVDESVTRVGAHLTDVRNEFAAGLVPPNDVSSVAAQESRERMLAVQARSNRDVAEAELVRLVGASPETAITIATPFEPVAAADFERSLAALLEEARAARPERQALVKRLTAAEARSGAAAAGNRPTVAVAGGIDYARPNPRIFPRIPEWRESWDASVNVNWSFYDGGKTRSETAEATANVHVLQEQLADFDATLAVEVRQRLSEVTSSRAAIAAAGDATRSADEARRVVGNRFQAGVATSTDVLDAQVALLQAQLDRTQAIANLRLADARLARALGR